MNESVEIQVSSEQVHSIIRGRVLFIELDGCEEAIAVHGSMPIAKLRKTEGEWAIVAVACSGPAHGIHPKYAELAEKIATLRRQLNLGGTGPCKHCDGSGWLDPQSQAAKKQAALAEAFGLFRGIENPDGPSQLGSAGTMLTLDALLGQAAVPPGDENG